MRGSFEKGNVLAMILRRVLPFALVLLAVACESDKKPVDQPPPVPPPAPADPTPNDAVAPPAEKKADPDCMGAEHSGTPAITQWNGINWEENGSTLTWTGAGRDRVIVGTVTDIKESSPENLENLKAFVAWFKKMKVDMIIVDGDSGTTQAGIESAIDVIASAQVPVFVIVGNGEGRVVYKTAMAAIHQRSPHVFDLVKIRRIHTPQADFVSLPGYFNPAFIHAKDGCQYYPADVAATDAIVKAAKAPVVLVSHGGPKQSGQYGVDLTTEGNHVGDPDMIKLMADNKIPFGIFGNIHEAGGQATNSDGSELIPQKKMVDQLYLNPGPSDAVTWMMNDKSESEGMAAIMTISKGKASYEIFRRGGKAAPVVTKAKTKKKGA